MRLLGIVTIVYVLFYIQYITGLNDLINQI